MAGLCDATIKISRPERNSLASKLTICTNVSPQKCLDLSSLSSGPSSTASSMSSGSSVCSEPGSTTTLAVNDILYSSKELRAMATELRAAHQTGEFPTTKFLNHNSQIIVDDYKRLFELREAADSNNKSRKPAVLVSITRDIRGRDAEMEERIERQRVLRHVDSCIRSVQEEERLYRIMQTALNHNTHTAASKHDLERVEERIASKDDLKRVEERIRNSSKHDMNCLPSKLDLERVEQRILDAVDAALLHSSAPLHQDIGQMTAHVSLISRQIDALQGALIKIESLNRDISSMRSSVTGIPAIVQQAVEESVRLSHGKSFEEYSDISGVSHKSQSRFSNELRRLHFQEDYNHSRQPSSSISPDIAAEPAHDHQRHSSHTFHSASTTIRRALHIISNGPKQGIYRMTRRFRRETVEVGVSLAKPNVTSGFCTVPTIFLDESSTRLEC